MNVLLKTEHCARVWQQGQVALKKKNQRKRKIHSLTTACDKATLSENVSTLYWPQQKQQYTQPQFQKLERCLGQMKVTAFTNNSVMQYCSIPEPMW